LIWKKRGLHAAYSDRGNPNVMVDHDFLGRGLLLSRKRSVDGLCRGFLLPAQLSLRQRGQGIATKLCVRTGGRPVTMRSA